MPGSASGMHTWNHLFTVFVVVVSVRASCGVLVDAFFMIAEYKDLTSYHYRFFPHVNRAI